jgi:hypothetical protein
MQQQISLTGNPFVDTGLAVIASLSNCTTIDELTLEHIKSYHTNGELLAQRNLNLRSTSMIFGINSLILQNQIKPEEKRLLYYSKMTTALLNNIGLEDVVERCECCGNRWSLDLDKLFRLTLSPLGYTEGKRHVGRDWFPLSGGIRNDVQALPSASRAPNLCAECLFAVQYLPLGVILINGKLCIFQSTSKNFWYDIVSSIAQLINERVTANNFVTIGSREGSAAAVERILDVMQNMHEDLEPETSLFIWLFSNSGQSPDCRVEQIPDTALRFLFEAIRHLPNRREIIDIIRNRRYSFLHCIQRGVDYEPLYPQRNFNGVSNRLFSLYQTYIRGVSIGSLLTAFKIARYISSNSTEKEFRDIGKNIDTNKENQNFVKNLFSIVMER